MPDNCYPGFEPGQTLTAEDLEVLRDFFDEQDRLTRKMVGFGVVCGLDGAIEGSEVVMSPGLAIDQDGDGALVDERVRKSTANPDEETFDFIDTGPGGFTPVLVIEDIEQPAPECDEEGCEGHATVWCREPRIVLVEGRLVVDPNDFATDPLLDEEPVTVSETGAVHGAFVGLRNAITSRWRNAGISLSADATAIFGDLSLPSRDLEGIKAYKAAFVNQVLFATLDLLRCMSLHRAACLRTDGDRAVALGWVPRSGATLTWDCRYRHHFQPPAGLVSAVLGGRCDDPCELYRSRLEALILNFRVPTVPEEDDPPSTTPPSKGDYHWCRPKAGYRRRWWEDRCYRWKVPPPRLREDWRIDYEIDPERVIIDRLDGRIDPPEDPWLLYGDPLLDMTQAGTLTLTPSLGKEAEAAGGIITEILDEAGMSPDVRIIGKGEVEGYPGFSREVTISMGDTVVLVSDDHGKVVSTGRIANARTVRGAEAGIADAVDKADGAVAAAGEAIGLVGGFDTRIGRAESTLGTLEGFRDETLKWKTEVGPKIVGIDQAVDLAVQQALPAVQTELQGFVNQVIGGEHDRWLGEAGGMMDEKLGKATRTFEQRAGAVEERAAFMEGQVDLAIEQGGQVGDRVDDLYKFSLVEGGRVKQSAANRQLVEVLGSMRRSIAVGAKGEAAEAVGVELAKADEALAVLQASAGMGEPVVEAAPAELGVVIESLVAAARTSGVPKKEMRRLERDAGTLIELLR